MTVNTIIERYVLDDRYSAGLQRATRATSALTQHVRAAHAASRGWASRMEGGFDSLVNMADQVKWALLAVGGAAVFAARQGAEMEAIEKSLEAVEGSADRARVAIEHLKEIAKLPGLGFDEAVKGFVQLRSSGASQQFSADIVAAIGKAVARSAGGREEFGGALTAVFQMLSYQRLTMQDIMQLVQRGVQAPSMLKAAFGTSSAEDLNKRGVTAEMAVRAMVAEIAKLPAVTETAKNSFENFGDAMRFSVSAVGKEINSAAVPWFNNLATAMGKVSESGAIQSLTNMMAVFESGAPTVDQFTDNIIVMMAATSTVNQAFADVGAGFRSIEEGTLKFAATMQTVGDQMLFYTNPGNWGKGFDFDKRWKENFGSGSAWEGYGSLGQGDSDFGGNPFAQWGSFFNTTVQSLKADLQRPRRRAGDLDDTGSGPGDQAPIPELTRAVDRNSDALERSARALERMIFGGGALGRYGVSPVEMGSGRGRGSQVNITVAADGPSIIREVMQLKRSGIL